MEFNSGFILEECNILETCCYVQCVKNRIQKLGTGLFKKYLVYVFWSESEYMYGSSEIVTGHAL